MIANIQFLRAVAASMIVLIHCGKLFASLGLGLPGWLPAGVDVFFVISGFIMVYTTSRNGHGPIGFVRDRLIRIVPVYWLFTLALFALNRTVPALGSWTASGADLARSLLFIPYGDAPQFFPLLYVGWTLNLELYFYGLFAIGMALSPVPARRVAIVTALISVPVAAAPFLPGQSVWQFYGLPMVLEFASGMVLGLAYRRLTSLPGWAGLVALVLGAGLLVLDPMETLTADAFVRFGLAATLIVGGAIVAESGGWRVTARLPLALGASSYALYCTHPLVISAFNNVQQRVPELATPVGGTALLAAAIVAAGVFGWIVHRGFERPVGRWLHRHVPAGPAVAREA